MITNKIKINDALKIFKQHSSYRSEDNINIFLNCLICLKLYRLNYNYKKDINVNIMLLINFKNKINKSEKKRRIL